MEGTPSQDAIDTDTRSAAQRNHDGLLAGLRGLLASGSWVSTTAYPRRSSCPPHWPNWKPLPDKDSPAPAPCCR
ncbi:hypothetical protein I546_3179 [Mycobacterium kansasii 732]|nr:hypothetical protein I546_3179 [Mycobacterium kansasii 732]